MLYSAQSDVTEGDVMNDATKRAIADIEKWSGQVAKDPDALGNKLTAERALFTQLLSKARKGLLAVNYTGWVMLKPWLGYWVPEGRISVTEGWGNRTVADIIREPGDFEELVHDLNRAVKEIVKKTTVQT